MYYVRSRRKSAKRRIAIILACAIAAAAALVIYLLFFSDFRINKPPLQDLGMKLPENVISTDSGLLYKSGDALSLMDFKGQTLWTLPVDSSENEFIASGTVISSFGKSNAQFFSYDKQQLFAASPKEDIVSVRCGNNMEGILTTGQDENGRNHSYIYIYDLKGNNEGVIDMNEKQIIDFGIYGDADMLWTLSLDTSGVVPTTYILTFKVDGTMTNSIEVNTQIVEKVYVTGDSIYASGTNSLTAYSYFGEKKDDTLIYGWQPYDVSIQGADIKMLYKTRSDSEDLSTISSAKLLDSSLAEVMIYFPREIFSVMITQNGIFAFANDTIYVYNNQTGEVLRKVKLDSPIDGAKKVSDKYAVIWDKTTSYLYALG